jgi:hypothetical protein
MSGTKPSEEMLARVKEVTMGKVNSFEDLVDTHTVPPERRKKRRRRKKA